MAAPTLRRDLTPGVCYKRGDCGCKRGQIPRLTERFNEALTPAIPNSTPGDFVGAPDEATGGCYECSEGVAKGPASAFKWFGKSAELGFPKGMFNLDAAIVTASVMPRPQRTKTAALAGHALAQETLPHVAGFLSSSSARCFSLSHINALISYPAAICGAQWRLRRQRARSGQSTSAHAAAGRDSSRSKWSSSSRTR